MIRLTVLAIFVAAICIGAFRHRFLALCGLVLLSVVSQNNSMPSEIAGIPGLNPWNLALAAVLVAWFVQRRKEPVPPAPRWFTWLAVAYFAMLMIGAVRCIFDINTIIARADILFASFGVRSTGDAFKELIINTTKFLLVGWLVYDGCRSSRNVWYIIGTIALSGLAYALLMYKSMKLMVFFGNYEDARRLTDKLIGLHANDLAGLLTMSLWLCVAGAIILKGRYRIALLAAVMVILPAMVGCHSRAAYLANIGIVIALGVVRWRKLLLAFPVVLPLLLLAFPQITERLEMGLDPAHATVTGDTDWNAVTAGRTYNIWAPVIAQIEHSPIIGYGRLAIGRTDATFTVCEREGFVPTHPHNSYLELMLDSGTLGLLLTIALLVGSGWMAMELLRGRGHPLVQLVGAAGFIAVVNTLVLGLSSQFFYPKQSLLWLFCSIAVTARVWAAQRARLANPATQSAYTVQNQSRSALAFEGAR